MENEIDKILKKHLSALRKIPNVISFSTTSTKFTDKKDTGVPCITFLVSHKTDKLDPDQRIPDEIDGFITDVVELKSDSFKIGKTSKSRLTPEQQRRLCGVIK